MDHLDMNSAVSGNDGLNTRTRVFRWLGTWAILAFVPHLLWEIGHLRFYTLAQDLDRVRVTAYLLHCVLGDVLIAIGAFLVAALATRRLAWPLTAPWHGGLVSTAVGMGFTIFSEWYNVYRVSAWAYTPDMPLIAGIGLTPLLQWALIPPLMIVLMRQAKIARRFNRV